MALRNIAIIAHVDHGKTTLVDQLLQQSGTIKSDEGNTRVMDSNDQEKERGITIYAKNTSVKWNDERINIIDTPGHADFGSEVERVLRMVDSVLLIVDAYEGPMPQTKFVLKKSLELGLQPLVVINKIDKPTARPDWVVDELFDLFVMLGATDEQADFPIVYASAKEGYAMMDPSETSDNMDALFKAILDNVPEAPNNDEKPFRMQIASLGYNDYVGRLGIGRIYEGTVKSGDKVTIIANDGTKRTGKISKLFTTEWLNQIEATEAKSGEIVTIAWIPDIFIGETVGAEADVEPMPAITIDEPTLTMDFLVNDSPFAGKEGKYMTTRILEERLRKEMESNVGLKVDFETEGARFKVSGRGELHLWVLIETIRREWFEMQVSSPQVIFKEEGGKKLEPIENVVINVAEDMAGTVIEMLSNRKGLMKDMKAENGLTTIEFEVPTRGLLGFRSAFILMTKGDGIVYSSFSHYDQYKGEIPKRNNGSMISWFAGKVMRYSVWKLQERGTIFVEPGQQMYEGMIVWESAKPGDLVINLTKNKKLTNMRAAWSDEAMTLVPIRKLTLEDALSYIGPDEYVEITPENIRLRKKHLKESDRKLAEKGAK